MSADEKVNDIFVEQLNVDKDKVVPNISFLDDLDADSLKLVKHTLEKDVN
jgi:acyl carrier protein